MSQWCIFLSMSCHSWLGTWCRPSHPGDSDFSPLLRTPLLFCMYSMVMLEVTFPAVVSFFWHAHWALCPGWHLHMLWHWVIAEAHLEGRAKSRCSFQSQLCLVCAVHTEDGARFYVCVIQCKVLGSVCVQPTWSIVLDLVCVQSTWSIVLDSVCVQPTWSMMLHSVCVQSPWSMELDSVCVQSTWSIVLDSLS